MCQIFFFSFGVGGAGGCEIDMRLRESKHSIIKHKRAFVKGGGDGRGPSLSGLSFCPSTTFPPANK